MVGRFKESIVDLLQGLTDGARNMIGIGLATATAGVIVGAVTLTGVGQVMADLDEFLSCGNLTLMLIMVGLLTLILGMSLPTTSNHIVVSSLMAGVVVELGAQSGLIVPLIAVHLFVFYFSIMADVTPPVGLASLAAAAVPGGDAIKTGFVAFFNSLRTVALPFVVIFNTDLLLIDVGWAQDILVFISASLAILVFTAGTMGWFVTKSRIYESVALVLIEFMLFRPDFFMDRIQPPFSDVEPASLTQTVETAEAGSQIRVVVTGPDFDTSEMRDTTILLAIGDEAPAERLAAMGLRLVPEGEAVMIEKPMFGSPHSSALADYDFYGDELVTVKDGSCTKITDAQGTGVHSCHNRLHLSLFVATQTRPPQNPSRRNSMTGPVLCAIDISVSTDDGLVLTAAQQMADLAGVSLDVVTVVPDYGKNMVGGFFESDHHTKLVDSTKVGLEAAVTAALGADVNKKSPPYRRNGYGL